MASALARMGIMMKVLITLIVARLDAHSVINPVDFVNNVISIVIEILMKTVIAI
jgi:hypothetical protein